MAKKRPRFAVFVTTTFPWSVRVHCVELDTQAAVDALIAALGPNQTTRVEDDAKEN